MELKHTPKGLQLHHERLFVQVDFLSPQLSYRRSAGSKHSSTQEEMLGKAVGIRSRYTPTVIDATAGFGKDAFILASLGCTVLMLERSSIVCALLTDGMNRAQQDPSTSNILMRLQLIETESTAFLDKLTLENYPDVIYLDPMFPERKKKALVKKEMQLLQSLLGADETGSFLLDLSLRRAKKRVVVKRPRLAPTLTEQKPSFCLTGRTSRFDIYLC